MYKIARVEAMKTKDTGEARCIKSDDDRIWIFKKD